MDKFIGELDDMDPKGKAIGERDVRLQQIPTVPSESLCSYIVLFRTLGMEKDFSIICMQELLRRRGLGDDFDFEAYIKEKCKTVQVPKSKLEGLKKWIR